MRGVPYAFPGAVRGCRRACRLDQALARALPQYSRARLQGWIEAGAVLVDGRRLRAKDKVLGGEQVEVAARLEADARGRGRKRMPLAVVHQDRGAAS